MSDNVLAKQVGKKIPQRRKTALEQLADEIEAYGGRVRDDFLSGAERSAQGLGDIVERGDVLTGIPRLALGGTGWMGAPVSAALSPILGPILQPVGEAVNTYVGQPVEDLTGYPADITNDLAMTGLTLGAAKGLGKTGPYLARAADEVEGLANRAGYTLRKPANVYGSGPTLTPLVDEAGGSAPLYYHGGGKLNAKNFAEPDAAQRHAYWRPDAARQQVYWVTPDKPYAETFARPVTDGGVHDRAQQSVYAYRLRSKSKGKSPDSQLDLTNVAARDGVAPEDFAELLREKKVFLSRQKVSELVDRFADPSDKNNLPEVWQYLKDPEVMDAIAEQHGSIKINEWVDTGPSGLDSQTVGVLNPNLLQRIAQSGNKTAVVRPNAIPRDLRGGLLPADGKWIRPKDKRKP
jgi:hypothetical protein